MQTAWFLAFLRQVSLQRCMHRRLASASLSCAGWIELGGAISDVDRGATPATACVEVSLAIRGTTEADAIKTHTPRPSCRTAELYRLMGPSSFGTDTYDTERARAETDSEPCAGISNRKPHLPCG
jgi:hypothetical protein